MPALTDPATWRTPYSYTPYLWIDRPPIVFAARVNQSAFTYPLVQLTFDTVTTGAYTDLITGMTVLIGSSAGADDLGRTYIRPYTTQTSSVIFIGESSQGVHDGEVNPADNMYITVLRDWRIWAVAARIDDDEIQYKHYDLPVSSGGRNYAQNPGPIANGGCARAALVDSGTGLATYSFSASDSIPFTSGSTISSYLWGVDGGTITVGTTTTSSITATFGVGRYIVSLRVTDSNGHTHTTYILVLALSLTDATWKPIQDFDIVDDTNLDTGKTMSFVIHEDIPAGTYPDGATVIYFEREYYNGVEGSLAGPATAKQVKFVGWLDTSRETPEATFQGIQRGVEFRCISSHERMKQLHLLPQLVKYKASGEADEWDELNGFTPTRMLLYILLWHSTATLCCPIVIDSLDSNVKRWATTVSDLASQLDEVGRSRVKKFTCDQRGILRLVTYPLVIESASRTSTVIVSVDGDDYDQVLLERQRAPRVYWLDGRAITLGTTNDTIKPRFSLAPGLAPGQGSGRSELGGLIVSDQAQLDAWLGNDYARANSPYPPLTIRMVRTGDAGIEPAFMEWIRVTIASNTNRRGISLASQRCLPVEVRVEHSNDYIRTKQVTITFIVETTGVSGTPISPEDGGLPSDPPGWDIFPPPSALPPQAGLHLYKGLQQMAMFATDGYVYITNNFGAVSPTWARYQVVSNAYTYKLHDFVCNAFCTAYLGTGESVDGWFITPDEIYKIADVFGARTVTLQKTLTTVTTTDFLNQMDSHFGAAGYAVALQHSSAGVRAVRTSDGGTNWTETLISAARHTGGSTGVYTDIFYSTRVSGLIYATGFTVNDIAFLYKSTNHGAAWSQVSPTGDAGIVPILALHIPWQGNSDQKLVYYGYFNGSQIGLRKVQVDTSGYVDITPTVSGSAVGPQAHWGIISDVNNRLRMAMIGINNTASVIALLTSVDGGTTWTTKQNLSAEYTRAYIAGDDGNILYLWGHAGRIAYSQDFGTTLQDKRGNIPTDFPSIGRIVRICGGTS